MIRSSISLTPVRVFSRPTSSFGYTSHQLPSLRLHLEPCTQLRSGPALVPTACPARSARPISSKVSRVAPAKGWVPTLTGLLNARPMVPGPTNFHSEVRQSRPQTHYILKHQHCPTPTPSPTPSVPTLLVSVRRWPHRAPLRPVARSLLALPWPPRSASELTLQWITPHHSP
jgi:hypothetical protein